jgi:hypothetical protein
MHFFSPFKYIRTPKEKRKKKKAKNLNRRFPKQKGNGINAWNTKDEKQKKPVQEQKMRMTTTALCRSLFVDQ